MFEENWDSFGTEESSGTAKEEDRLPEGIEGYDDRGYRVGERAAKKRRRDEEDEEEMEVKTEEEWQSNGLTFEQERELLMKISTAYAGSGAIGHVSYACEAEKRFISQILNSCRSVKFEDEPSRKHFVINRVIMKDENPLKGVLMEAKRMKEKPQDTFRRVVAALRGPRVSATMMNGVSCILCDDMTWQPLEQCVFCDDEACAELWLQTETAKTLKLFGKSEWSRCGMARHSCTAMWRSLGAKFVSDYFKRNVGERTDAAEDYDLMAFLKLNSDRIQQYMRETRKPLYDSLMGDPTFLSKLNRLKIVRCSSIRVHYMYNSTGRWPKTAAAAVAADGETKAFPVQAMASFNGDGDTLCYMGLLPKPIIHSAVLLELTKLFSINCVHQSQRLWRLFVSLARSRENPTVFRHVSPHLPINERKWDLCAANVSRVSSITALEPISTFNSATAFIGSRAASDCAKSGWDITVYNGMFHNPQKTSFSGYPKHVESSVGPSIEEVGRIGEQAAYNYLVEQYASNPAAKVVWPSEEVEGGLPYDLFVTFPGGVHYYEVKATTVSYLLSFLNVLCVLCCFC